VGRQAHARLRRHWRCRGVRARARHPGTRHLAGRAALLAKLVEEAREAENAPDDELAGELADVWEVFQTLLATLPLTRHELEALAAAKPDKRGGFDGRIYLEYTEQAPGTPPA
jgi:predicted house-cleaning noncanonical NTP pyrophosphatase (MazG superfamily)